MLLFLVELAVCFGLEFLLIYDEAFMCAFSYKPLLIVDIYFEDQLASVNLFQFRFSSYLHTHGRWCKVVYLQVGSNRSHSRFQFACNALPCRFLNEGNH